MQRPGTAPPTLGTSRILGHGGLRRQKTSRFHHGKKLVVAVDGSKMSQRAVLLAAWLHDEGSNDKVKIVCVSDAKTRKTEALDFIKDGERQLSMHGVHGHYIEPGEVLTIGAGSNLVDTIANAARGGNLILGADGKKVEEKDSVCLGVMGKSRAPVLLAKPKATPSLGSVKGTQLRRDGKMGLAIVVAVDGSHIAQKCLDMAVRFVRAGDTVTCFHVKNADRNVISASEVCRHTHTTHTHVHGHPHASHPRTRPSAATAPLDTKPTTTTAASGHFPTAVTAATASRRDGRHSQPP